ncbi:MAG: CvpA family protein [Deltaproteobacteria bacterium]|nr:CvpA family protein [Deltaproteobacteria bacterium]
MNLLDTIIIVIVGATFVMSLFRGVVKEVFSLGSLILGFVIANQTYGYLAEFLMRYIHHDSAARILGYVAVFLGSSIVIRLMGTYVERWTRKAMLGWMNHLIGGLFGFLKGSLLVSVIIILMGSFMPGSRVLQESRLTPYILSTVGVIAEVSPGELKKQFFKTKDRLEKHWKEEGIAALLRKQKEGLEGK